MRGFFKVVLVMATGLLASGFARADGGGDLFPAGGRLEVSAGPFTPRQVETRSFDTSTWFRLSVGYRLGDGVGATGPALFLDIAAQSGRRVEAGSFWELRRRRSFVGLGGALTASARVPGTGWAVDASAGGGLYFLEIADDYSVGGGSSNDPARVLARGTNPGVRLRVALRDRRGYFVEAAYFGVGQLHGLDYGGITYGFGKRF